MKPQDNKLSGDPITLKNPRVIPIEGTPFATVQKDENQYVLIFGQNMITPEVFTSRGAAEKEINRIDWIKILNVIGIYVENALKNNDLKFKNNE